MVPEILGSICVIISVLTLILLWKAYAKISAYTQTDVEAAVREEMRCGREEAAISAKSIREEISQTQNKALQVLVSTLNALAKVQKERLEDVVKAMTAVTDTSRNEAIALRGEIAKNQKVSNDALVETIGKMAGSQKASLDEVVKSVNQIVSTNRTEITTLRDEIKKCQTESNDAFLKVLNILGEAQKTNLDEVVKSVNQITITNRTEITSLREELKKSQKESHDAFLKTLDVLGNTQKSRLDEVVKCLNQVIDRNRAEIAALKEEVKKNQKDVNDSLITLISNLGNSQKERLGEMTKSVNDLIAASKQESTVLRDKVEKQFKEIQASNEQKLEQMRKTVDEKLHATLEQRLGASFKLVSERLEAVHRGLGEMQNLANGVGDLKRVLTNVKARGTWGEIQLGAILEQVLTPDQYAANVQTKENTRERVEYAVRLPGRNGDGDNPVWLPIDAKFPKEDYDRLVDASAAGDLEKTKEAAECLLGGIDKCAKEISEKHVNPPHTTDFAIMFLPTEGLYAEVLRQPGMHELLQQKYRIIVAGPTTLAAVLNSLRMGFHTLAIEKRSSEVWRILGAVKTEFGKFGDIIDKVKGQLATAANTLDKTAVRTRAMNRKLSTVSALPQTEAEKLLKIGEHATDLEEELEQS